MTSIPFPPARSVRREHRCGYPRRLCQGRAKTMGPCQHACHRPGRPAETHPFHLWAFACSHGERTEPPLQDSCPLTPNVVPLQRTACARRTCPGPSEGRDLQSVDGRTGVGRCACSRIADVHAGRRDAKSEQEAWSGFVFRTPQPLRSPQPAFRSTPPVPRTPEASRRERGDRPDSVACPQALATRFFIGTQHRSANRAAKSAERRVASERSSSQ